MAFGRRKRKVIDLDQALNAYEATAMPVAAPAPAVVSIPCWSCARPNLYDARRPPPRRCAWCRSVLK